ncbi:MAG: TadE/TadG family type IV pilus assembly protein [Marmoricola sp.]
MSRTPRRRDQRGAVMVEFALLLPVLLTLVAGLFDFAMVFNLQLQASQAAQAGARVAAIAPTNDDLVRQRATAASPTLAQQPNFAVTNTDCASAGTGSASVHVGVTGYTLPIPIPGVGTFDIGQRAVTPC